jgi:ribosomal protein S12 methylthiotransferase accessory factor
MTDGRSSVALVGNGPLADRLPFTPVETVASLVPGAFSAVVAVGHPLREVQEHAAAAGIPLLPIDMDTGWTTVGPLVRPDAPGCLLCVARRRYRNRADAEARQQLRRRHRDRADDNALPPMIADVVAALVTEQLDPVTNRVDGAVLRISVLDGSVRHHRFLPDPSCPRCASLLPPDSGTATAPSSVPLPKSSPGTFRLRDVTGAADGLRDLYVDAEIGLIASIGTGWLAGVANAVARLSPGRDPDDSQHGYGRTESFASARNTALIEALERYGCERRLSRRTVVRGTYAELRSDALDPRALGTPTDDLYALPGYPYVPFAPDQEVAWVWGYSFTSRAPVLVPESVAYLSPGRDLAWFQETSNGCAVGSCFDEAVLHGLLEVAERDAFLMTWYGKLPLPRIDLDSISDRRVPVLAGLFEQRFRCDVMVFAALMEQRIPAFVLLAVRREEQTGPALACTAAAHPDPVRAIHAGLQELGPILHGLSSRYDPDSVAPLLADPMLVTSMDQHAALYTHPDARTRMDFLTAAPAQTGLDRVVAQAAWPRHDDLAADLGELTGRYLATGLDVIAVDTTSPEQAAGGFSSAKVIVPGTVPMTFGHPYRRTTGLPRLLTVPARLGYRDTALSFAELNSDPHPFP